MHLNYGWMSIFGAFALLISSGSRAQDANPAPTVTFDLENHVFDRQLPHGKSFNMDVQVPKSIGEVRWRIWLRKRGSCKDDRSAKSFATRLHRDDETVRVFRARIPSLRFSGRYCFSVEAAQQWTEDLEAGLVESLVGAPVDLARTSTGVTTFTAYQVRKLVEEDLPVLRDHHVLYQNEKKDFLDIVSEWAVNDDSFIEMANHAGAMLTASREVSINFESVQAVDVSQDSGSGIGIDLKRLGSYQGSIEAHQKLVNELGTVVESLGQDFGGVSKEAIEDSQALALGLATRLELLMAVACQGNAPAQAGDKVSQAKLRRFCRRVDNLYKASILTQQSLGDLLRASSVYSQAYASYSRKVADKVLFFRDSMSKYASLSTFGHIEGGTRQEALYFGGDVGFLFAFFMDEKGKLWDQDVAIYVGAALHFAPVDSSVPLAVDGRFSQRFSLIIGFTIDDLTDEDGTISGPLLKKSPVAGFGYRITDHMRLGGGLILYNQTSRNPLVESAGLRVAPYLSLSVNFAGATQIGKKFKEGREMFEDQN